MDNKKVLDEVEAICQRVGIEHPRLFRWVQFRLAELRLLTESTVLPNAPWRANEVRLRRKLVVLSGLLWRDPQQALAVAEALCAESLRFAYSAVHQLLQPSYTRSENETTSKPRLHASLMVPFRALESVRSAFEATDSDLKNCAANGFQTAEELWKQYTPQVDRFLVLVAETIRPRKHTGFWVPVSETETLPGAADAFLNGRASVVAKERVPPLHSQPLGERWGTYIRQKVHGSFFVSVPVFADDDVSENRLPVGVVNVNVGTPNDRVWERALHPGWLKAAASATAPFAEIAHYATLAWFAALQQSSGGSRPNVELDTPNPMWNAFPGVTAHRALSSPPEEKDDGRQA